MRAFTLVETVLALFVLSLILVFFMTMLASSLGQRGRLQSRVQAVQEAQNRIARLRAASRTLTGFRNLAGSTEEAAGLRIVTEVSTPELFSPASLFEENHPAAARRALRGSTKRVNVKVYNGPELLLEMPTLVREPERTPRSANALVLTPNSAGPLAPGLPATFRCQLFDSNNEPIPDVFPAWSIVPIDGNATLKDVARDGSQATLVNQYKTRRGFVFQTGGSCRMAATVRYHGKTFLATSDPIVLLKP